MAQPEISIQKILGAKHNLIAACFLMLGLIIKLLPVYLHKEGKGWEIVEEIGTFLALVVAVHLLYEIHIKREEHQIFIKEMRNQLKEELKEFSTANLTEMQDKLNDSMLISGLIKESVDTFRGSLPRIDYLKIDNKKITEATVYKTAIDEINKARKSIDVFTSYLLEVDSKDAVAKEAKDSYFASLLLPFKDGTTDIVYQRIIQAPLNTDLEDALGEKSATYLEHINHMLALRKDRKSVYLWSIDKRRPTTYVIIDDKILLWQINQIGENEEMKMYGMFIAEDPLQVLIKHFRIEFDDYLKDEAVRVNTKTILRA